MLEEPNTLIAELENDLASYALEKKTPLMNSSFQAELQSVFPYLTAKTEDYTDELEENCYWKNVPKEFIAKISLEELNMMYQHQSESSFSVDSDQRAVTPIYNLKDYMISIEPIILGEDKRTMIVIRNIPMQYSPKALFEELKTSFSGKFNYFYLPYTHQSKKNNGYALINFTHPLHVISFYDLYHKKTLKHNHSKKNLNIFYSKFTFQNQPESSQAEANNSLIPLTYLKLFRRIYRRSLCIVKERNYCDEGYFIVKVIRNE